MWIWQSDKSRGKGSKAKGGKGGHGQPDAKGGGKDKVYVYCATPNCKGRVFMGSQPVPEKCKVCHHCDVPFVFPNPGKGGNLQGINPTKVKNAKGGLTTPAASPPAVTKLYDQLLSLGVDSEQAKATILELGHAVPKSKPAAAKQPVDGYAKLSKLNGEILSMQNILEQKEAKYVRLSDELMVLFDDITARKITVKDMIEERATQQAALPNPTLFPTVNAKPPEVAEYLREVESDWNLIIDIGNSSQVPEDLKQSLGQLQLLRDRTLQACKLQHEHIAFPTNSFEQDALELASASDVELLEADDLGEDNVFPPEYGSDVLVPSAEASSSNYPDLASRQEAHRKHRLCLARVARPKRGAKQFLKPTPS